MDQAKKPATRIEPERPSPMYKEPAMTLREVDDILTPRWLRRLMSRQRSS